jgi:23S rRNA (guanosine2251-2'-O)-methyltransferase
MIIYGVNPVIEALRANWPLTELTVASGKRGDGIARVEALAQEKAVPVRQTRDISKLTEGNRAHQGVCARMAREPAVPLPNTSLAVDRWVMLDGIQDPHNFGAALRVCECFGFHHVIYHRGNSCGVTPTAIKVSAGAFFHLTLYVSNLNAACRRLQRDGVHICVLDGAAELSLDDAELPTPYCLVVGSEGRGVRHAIRRLADTACAIPLYGRINSLNVSCALTAALASCRRRG